jgi:hypothetical protein
MNERIEELKKQAWEYTMAVHDGLVVPPPEKPVWPVDEVYDEKFAELIVRECGVVAYKTYCQTPGALGIQYKQAIEEHFGVEE